MARHPIFCVEEVKEPLKIGMKSAYTYKEGIFTIYRKYNNSWKAVRKFEVKPYEAVELLVKGGRTTLIKMSPPPNNIPLIAWLCGAPKNCYTTSRSEYEEKIQEYYDERTSDIECYDEWEETSSSYCFMWTRRCEKWAKNYCVAYFISEAISLREILELVCQKGVYPSWYNFKLLSERFGVTEEMFELAQKQAN